MRFLLPFYPQKSTTLYEIQNRIPLGTFFLCLWAKLQFYPMNTEAGIISIVAQNHTLIIGAKQNIDQRKPTDQHPHMFCQRSLSGYLSK